MKKATPVEMRKSLEMVDALKKAGIRFVPIPALDDDHFESLINELDRRLIVIKKECDK